MMKLKLLIILTLLSIFGFACSSSDTTTSTSTSTSTVTPGIQVVNVSDNVSTTDIETWTTTAAAKMSSQTANILIVSWDIGAATTDIASNGNFNTHTVLLTTTQIDSLMTSISTWFDTTCMTSTGKTEELAKFRAYITNGADVASHYQMCGEYRLVFMGFPTSMSAATTKSVILHELYHALQHDIGDETCVTTRESNSDSNFYWLVEGAAQYHAKIESLGSSTGVNTVLKEALAEYNSDSNASITSSGVATRGAAGIRYLIEKGGLTEASILDGSFFHSCGSETNYANSNDNVTSTKSNWYKILNSSESYSFQ